MSMNLAFCAKHITCLLHGCWMKLNISIFFNHANWSRTQRQNHYELARDDEFLGLSPQWATRGWRTWRHLTKCKLNIELWLTYHKLAWWIYLTTLWSIKWGRTEWWLSRPCLILIQWLESDPSCVRQYWEHHRAGNVSRHCLQMMARGMVDIKQIHQTPVSKVPRARFREPWTQRVVCFLASGPWTLARCSKQTLPAWCLFRWYFNQLLYNFLLWAVLPL